MVFGIAAPALAATSDMFFGIRDNGMVDQFDPITGEFTTLIDAVPPVLDTSPSGPNGLGYDEISHRLYFAEYTDSNADGKANLYFTDLDDSPRTVTYVGQLPDAGNSPNRGVSDADIYNGVYYYVNHGTDDFRAVTFAADGVIDVISAPIDVANNQHAWTFDGDIAIWDGVVYGWGRCTVHGKYEFFKFNVDGSGLVIMDNTLTTDVGSVALQLAFDANGVLYGHNYGSGRTYRITWDSLNNVTAEFLWVNTSVKYTDTASGSTSSEEECYSICGFKRRADTDAPVAGWTIYLEKQVDGQWTSAGSALTGEDGKYCFTDLPAGTYRVSEEAVDGWDQVFPDGDGKHVVTLPNATMIYGIQRSTGKIFKADPLAPNAATLVRQIDQTLVNKLFSSTSPNGIGFDQATGDVYFATYPAPSRLYKFEGDVQRDLGALTGSVASGEFYNGKFYYVADETDDLYVVSFKADGTIDTITPHMSISADVSRWYFGDVVVDHSEGVIYGEGQNLNSGKQEFFKVNLDGTGYVRISSQLVLPTGVGLLQLAIGTTNELYAHSAATGDFFTIDRATGAVTTVSDGANLYTDISSASVVYYNFVNAPVPGHSISGYKWYDRDKDGTPDEMPGAGIEGWKMSLYEWQLGESDVWDWVKVDEALTGAGGIYSFDQLEPGLYKVEEGVDADPATCWKSTTDVSQQVTVADADVADINFGNVCEKTSSGGFTLGYWSNKNGSGELTDYNDAAVADPSIDPATWQAFLSDMNLVNKVGVDYDPSTYTAFRAWLLKADATNMSYMLSVQMAATGLNILVENADYAGYGVLDMDGSWISVNALIAKANVFLDANTVTTLPSAERTQAEFYKNIFDRLNNNTQVLIKESQCDLPVW